MKDISAISDHALSSRLPVEGVLSDRVIAADCALPVSEFAQEARCAERTLSFSFWDRLPVLMEAVDDEMVVRVVIYTIAVMCMILMLFCRGMLDMMVVVVATGHECTCDFKLQALCCSGRCIYKLLWSIVSRSHDGNTSISPIEPVRATVRRLGVRMIRLFLVQPQAHSLVSGRVESPCFLCMPYLS